MMKQYRGVVMPGNKTARLLGFPTANLDPSLLDAISQDGVYAAEVDYANTSYQAALYLGPRLNLGETNRVLEIHLIDFRDDLYGKTLTFKLGSFIRKPEDFASVDDLQHQLADDIAAVRAALV